MTSSFIPFVTMLGFALCSTSALAQAEPASERTLLLGAGAYVSTNPYTGADDTVETGLLPFFVYKTDRFNIDLSGLSVTAFEVNGFTLEGRLSPRYLLVDPGEIQAFKTLKRDIGLDAGIKVTRTMGGFEFSAEYLHDVVGETKGGEANLVAAYGFSPMERMTVGVAGTLSWKDSELATWLYGIRREDGLSYRYEFGDTPNTPSKGVFVPSLGVQMRYQLTERLSVFTAAQVEIYNSDITDSPLMKEDYSASGFISLVRQF
ncbi:MipA/OmpV family protein [Woodsholea maritima]|uniref:MipA/OmpV family protein n=1 Tax=Woodsholea maritima TaxID=240237 RepID=UPI00036D3ED8|nr:MipA/OmpV family protein [Woodsholea maritima]